MLFQLVQEVYWLALSVWFGGAVFIGVAVQVIHRTVRQYDPRLPRVLSANLVGQHSTLLAGAIVGNLISVLTKIELACAVVLLPAVAGQWFILDVMNRAANLMRSGFYLAAAGIVVYNWMSLWPRILTARQQFIDHADDPDQANPASERLDELQRENETLLMILVFLLLGMVLFSGAIARVVPAYTGK